MDKKRKAEMFLVLQSWGLSTVPPSTHDTAKKKKISGGFKQRKTKIRQVSSYKQANSKTQVTCIAQHPDNVRVIYGFSCKRIYIKILKFLSEYVHFQTYSPKVPGTC